ncbi:hypothetical protein DWF00_01080 [Bosea caraganae]|uniref:Glycosyl transferase n=1 Tax=Bosea caraganae TaxID=2763117 RepID=A0A370L8T9_9HYPH|nr:DUF6492 family protein [Bosea caraganae]RDJ26803.1 hypothetical protein DWE98_08100 [Bosea caraganae]RDJ30689.1 hypothetical protein DWF00_01080 [Bosea caraganae]
MSFSYAIATPSYAGDYERCRLLCASIDRFVSGHGAHYLLVEDRDLALFKPLAGPKRRVIAEAELLPSWLKSWPDPLTLGRRRVWTGLGALSRGVPPLRGWHAQQLRKLTLPLKMAEDVVLFADSDMIFLRPFDLGSLEANGAIRLYRKPANIKQGMADHVAWCEGASRLLGLPAPGLPSDDYINNLVSWRRDNVAAMMALIEKTTGRDWVSAVAGQRQFSEYMIYGYYVDRVRGLDQAGHWPDALELCKVYWGGDAEGIASLRTFEDVLGPGQVAVGVQSFIGQPVEQLRALFEAQ